MRATPDHGGHEPVAALMGWPFRRRSSARGAEEPQAAAAPALAEGWFEQLLSRSGFLRRYPQHAGIIARLVPTATRAVPYMAVGLCRWDDPEGQVRLFVNPDFVRERPDQVPAVLLHEIHHVVLGHLFDARFHAVAYPLAMEYAMEISANEHIVGPSPPGVFLREFRKFGLRVGQSTLERYRLLADAVESDKLRLPHLDRKSWDRHRVPGSGQRTIGIGDLLDARSDRARSENWARHGLIGGPSSEGELQRMAEAIRAHLGGEREGGDVELSGAHRRVAKELPRRLLGSATDPRLDWRRILREVFPVQRQVRPDYKRPNRRFPERVGELPGRTRRPPRPHLLAAVDTSGSMDLASLERVVAELRSLAAHARLTIFQCDAAAHRVRSPADLDLLTGGGDTDFGPVFAELGAARDAAGVVYFTDGRGEMPEAPPRLPTLWVVPHERPFAPPFGTIVRLT